jgi:hypothetical protein
MTEQAILARGSPIYNVIDPLSRCQLDLSRPQLFSLKNAARDLFKEPAKDVLFGEIQSFSSKNTGFTLFTLSSIKHINNKCLK